MIVIQGDGPDLEDYVPAAQARIFGRTAGIDLPDKYPPFDREVIGAGGKGSRQSGYSDRGGDNQNIDDSF